MKNLKNNPKLLKHLKVNRLEKKSILELFIEIIIYFSVAPEKEASSSEDSSSDDEEPSKPQPTPSKAKGMKFSKHFTLPV